MFLLFLFRVTSLSQIKGYGPRSSSMQRPSLRIKKSSQANYQLLVRALTVITCKVSPPSVSSSSLLATNSHVSSADPSLSRAVPLLHNTSTVIPLFPPPPLFAFFFPPAIATSSCYTEMVSGNQAPVVNVAAKHGIPWLHVKLPAAAQPDRDGDGDRAVAAAAAAAARENDG
jgi:hypothetical protein